MADELKFQCSEVKAKVKPFLEDLVTDEEYQAIFEHLDRCPECTRYIRSLGSISNQLWKLGDIDVPSDFASTILFNIDNAPEEPAASKPKASKNILIIAVTLVVAAATVMFVMKYISANKPAPKTETITGQMIVEKTPSGDKESAALFEELQNIADKLKVTEKKPETAEAPAEAEAPKEKSAEPLKEESAQKANLPTQSAVDLGPLHWHVKGSAKTDTQEIDSKKSGKELSLQKKRAESSQLAVDIAELQSKVRGDLGKVYEGSDEVNASKDEKSSAEAELAGKIAEKAEVDAATRTLEEEIRSLSAELSRVPAEDKRKETELEDRINSSLSAAGLRQDAREANLIIWSGVGKAVSLATEKILAAFSSSSFNDYTRLIRISEDNEYRGSIYIDSEISGIAHWHVSTVVSGEKARVTQILRENCGVPDREAESLLVFSVAAGGFENLRQKMMAARVSFEEFGNAGDSEKKLSSAPVKLSVYFK
jgi:hypothetical protein